MGTNNSDELAASIFRVKEYSSMLKMETVTLFRELLSRANIQKDETKIVFVSGSKKKKKNE
jgi:hypothetical protein